MSLFIRVGILVMLSFALVTPAVGHYEYSDKDYGKDSGKDYGKYYGKDYGKDSGKYYDNDYGRDYYGSKATYSSNSNRTTFSTKISLFFQIEHFVIFTIENFKKIFFPDRCIKF